ncbi:MFS transporter [Kitasatospora aureofaciens]|uniref:Transporter n=1 Tax=Kitasatospora aureofaciens TaxID=1894 RepID=A0A1E7MZS2_KITAU|nr:MFS transporter [Kitasatospora aureofaciens]ARF77768.1 MFS transporter [Kitasatospora aureofaciens]OEV33925.1 transporter [Kitasatospora aureofaciens]GGU74077.1 MFS transporter [Kitasatospora aureofaciens]
MTTAEPLPRTAGTVGLDRRQVHAVAACYFVASFAALGLPPYLTEILPGLGDRDGHWAGLLYIVPTVFTALGAPLWGRLADRFGQKRLLLRAQLGLAVSFLLAGAADSLPAFTVALVFQGFLGGTFSATNGYLAAALDGSQLSRALTLMQGSARAALVAAPILVGTLSPWIDPHRQYLVLAVLPLTAAVLLNFLPEPVRPVAARTGRDAAEADPPGSLRLLYTFEFAFVFATIISFPYLITLVQQRLPGVNGAVAGLLFALPHLVYLVGAGRVHSAVEARPRTGLAVGFALVALGLAGHAPAHSLLTFALTRAVLGLGMTFGLVCLAVLAAEAARGRAPGRMFGTRETVSKCGAVAAGLAAALANGSSGPAAPVVIGTVAALAAALLALLTRRSPR